MDCTPRVEDVGGVSSIMLCRLLDDFVDKAREPSVVCLYNIHKEQETKLQLKKNVGMREIGKVIKATAIVHPGSTDAMG